MLQRDPGAALLLETWLTKTRHIHGVSSLDVKSVQRDKTHQSQTYKVDLFLAAHTSFKPEDVYKKVFETAGKCSLIKWSQRTRAVQQVRGNLC